MKKHKQNPSNEIHNAISLSLKIDFHLGQVTFKKTELHSSNH